MNIIEQIFNNNSINMWLLLLLVIWDTIWKLIALWNSAKNKQIGWFISLAILNTAGILPIIYLSFFQKKN